MTPKVPNPDGSDTSGVESVDDRARGLADVYAVVGVLYRQTVAELEHSEHHAGLGVGVRAVLETLDARGPLPVPRIAETLALSRQFVQRTVNAARADGLVAVADNPAHRRSVLIEATERGRDAVAAVRAAELRALAPVAEPLDADEIAACLRVLRAMRAGLDDGAV